VLTGLWNENARLQSISSVSGQATARRGVVYDKALCILTTGTITGIFAFIIDASFVAMAVGTKYALRPAASVRVTEILGLTLARASAITLPADGVSAAGRGTARVSRLIDND
jgi:hypothetical protein